MPRARLQPQQPQIPAVYSGILGFRFQDALLHVTQMPLVSPAFASELEPSTSRDDFFLHAADAAAVEKFPPEPENHDVNMGPAALGIVPPC